MKLAAILLAACAVTNGTMTFRTVQSGAYAADSIERPMVIVARDPITLRNVWNIYIKHGEAPPINFEKESLAFLFLGSKPTGGWAINAKSAAIENDVVTIDTEIVSPGRGIVTQAFTSAYTVVAIAKKNVGDVRWTANDRVVAAAKRAK